MNQSFSSFSGTQASCDMVEQKDRNKELQSGQKEVSSERQHLHNDQEAPCRSTEPDTIDRISDLPDCLLHHILSFLPSQEVVRTSVLSMHWERLWTSVPCIRMDANEFEENDNKFSNFVSCLLRHREDCPLKVFCVNSSVSDEADSWISYAIDQKVESLEFSDDIRLEPFILGIRIVDFSSRHLKRLVLANVSLSSVHFSQLNNHCPELQIMELKDTHLETFEISSSSLLSLDIRDCTIHEDLLICAPKLTVLSIINPQHKIISLENLLSLVQATITLSYSDYLDSDDDDNYVDSDDDDNYVDRHGYNIVHGLSQARTIELLAPIWEYVLEEELLSVRGPLFNNLRSLTLGEWCVVDKLYAIEWFLQQAPLLEHLTLKLVPTHEDICKMDKNQHIVSPLVRSFKASSLIKVTVYCRSFHLEIPALEKLLSAANYTFEIRTNLIAN